MGCKSSKAAAIEPVAACKATSQDRTLLMPSAETKPEPSLRLKIASAHGLRPADLIGNTSEVFVEAMIEGKPESKVTTAVVGGVARKSPEAQEGAKPCIEVEFQFEAELKGYVAGDRVAFTVKDKDFLQSDVMGKATVSEGSFGGKLMLDDAGEGYDAFLMVQLGEGGGLALAAAEVQQTLEKTKQKLAEAMDLAGTAHPLKVLEAADMAADALADAAVEARNSVAVVIEDVIESKGAVCCSC